MWNISSGIRLFCNGMVYLLLVGNIFGPVSKAHAQTSGKATKCSYLFQTAEDVFPSRPDRLYDYYLNEVEGLSVFDISTLNNQFMDSLNHYTPAESDTRAQAIDERRAQKVLNIVNEHPVVGFRSYDKYSQPGEEMGFCFGRTMYMHLLALKLGLQKSSIKKIWAVGPMQSGISGVHWGYHVGLLVFSKERGWIVLDPNQKLIVTLNEWVGKFQKVSLDQRIRFYATEPEKFGLYAGQYSRYLLGLDLTVDQDWFKHYFVEMLAAFRAESLENLGLRKMTPEEGKLSTAEPGWFKSMLSFFQF